MVKTIEIYKKDVSTEEWEQALNRRESGDKYKITGADYWFEWSDDSFRLLLRDSGLIEAIRKVKPITPNKEDNKGIDKNMQTNIKIRVTPEQSAKIQQICFKNRVFWVTGRSTISFVEEPFLFIGSNIALGYATQEDYFKTHHYQEVPAELFIRTNGTCEEDPRDKTEEAQGQAENLDGILAERGAVYGDYGIHAKAVGDIMTILQNVFENKNAYKMSSKVQAMNFYVASKLVRLAATPIHEDSLKDAINYLKLMYKEIHGKEIQ